MLFRSFFHEELECRTAMAWVFFSSTIWGLLWIPLRYMDAIGVEDLWATLTFLLLPVPVLLWWRGRAFLEGAPHRAVYITAGICMGAGFVFYCTGLVAGSVIKTTLLFYLTPVWSTLLGMVFLREKPGRARWLAIATGLGGCVLIIGLWREQLHFDRTDWLGLLSGIFWAVGSVIIRRYPDADFTLTTLVQYVSGSVMILAAALLIGAPAPAGHAVLSAMPVAVATAVIFFPTVIIILRINQYISPGLVGLLMLSEALFALISAWLLLGENLAPLQWLGAVMIIATAVIVAFGSDEKSGAIPS